MRAKKINQIDTYKIENDKFLSENPEFIELFNGYVTKEEFENSINNRINYTTQLYEGLIKSYSPEEAKRYVLRNILKNENFKNNLKYSYISNYIKALPYIKISYKILSNKDKNKIISWFKVCGWELTDEYDNYLIFRAKFDTEIERNNWPKYLYHATPIKNLHKIKEKGLVPKSNNKKLKHQDAIYLFDISTEDSKIAFNLMINELGKYEKNNLNFPNNKYIIFKINTGELPNSFRLFVDPDSYYGFFTKENISYSYLQIDKNITLR